MGLAIHSKPKLINVDEKFPSLCQAMMMESSTRRRRRRKGKEWRYVPSRGKFKINDSKGEKCFALFSNLFIRL